LLKGHGVWAAGQGFQEAAGLFVLAKQSFHLLAQRLVASAGFAHIVVARGGSFPFYGSQENLLNPLEFGIHGIIPFNNPLFG
jgi:hypothetical protein